MHKILWLDLETTGVDPINNRIVEIGAIYQDLKNDIIKEFQRYIKYDNYPDNYDEVIEVHGLTREFLAENGKSERAVYYDFMIFLDGLMDRYNRNDKCILAGYNVTFDDDFAREMFIRFKNEYYGSYISFLKIDVVNLIAQCNLAGIIPNLPNYKLDTIIDHLQIKSESHKAIEDIRVTKLVYEMLSEKLKEVKK